MNLPILRSVHPFSLGLVLWVSGAFGVLNAIVRRWAGSTLAMDDPKTNLFTQVWQWGYQPDNPPLYEWLLTLLSPLTGAGLWGFLILKYLGLTAAAGFAYQIARRSASAREAFWCAVGLVLLYQIGFNFHQAFTHSALLVPAVLGGLWVLLLAIERPGWRRFALLGIIIGVSLLTKYNAALFWGGALIAVALDRNARSALCGKPSILLVPAFAMLIVLPHGVWFLGQTETYRASIDATLGMTGDGHLSRSLEGLGSLVGAALSFFLPWGFVAIAMRPNRREELLPAERFLLTCSAGALAVLVLCVLAFGIGQVSERYLIPVLLPAYLGATLWLLRVRSDRQGWFAASAVGMAGIVLIYRFVAFTIPGQPFCDECRHFIPYDALRAEISKTIEPGATLIVREENTGGNLVAYFPASPVRVFTSKHLTNPILEKHRGQPCYLVWSKDMIDPDIPLEPPILYVEHDPRTIMVRATYRRISRPMSWGITPLTDDYMVQTFCTPDE